MGLAARTQIQRAASECQRVGHRTERGTPADGQGSIIHDIASGVVVGAAGKSQGAGSGFCQTTGTVQGCGDEGVAGSVARGIGGCGQGAILDCVAARSRCGNGHRTHRPAQGAQVQSTTPHGQGAACRTQGAGAGERQGAAVDGRASNVGVRPGKCQKPGSHLRQAAGARHLGDAPHHGQSIRATGNGDHRGIVGQLHRGVEGMGAADNRQRSGGGSVIQNKRVCARRNSYRIAGPGVHVQHELPKGLGAAELDWIGCRGQGGLRKRGGSADGVG